MLPLLPFLAPSIPPLWRTTVASPQGRLPVRTSPKHGRLSMHTTARRRKDSSTADLDFLEDKPSPKPKPGQTSWSPLAQRRPSDNVLGNQVDKLIDEAFNSPDRAKRTSTGSSGGSWDGEPSDVMMDTAFRNSLGHRTANKPYHEIAQKMQFPTQETASEGETSVSSRNIYRALQENTQRPTERAERTVRSRPAVGRTIEVLPEKGVDVGRALRNLDILCAVNRVRNDSARQRYYERPGLKKKRLKRERWRKTFMQSFRATVMRVREMRRKGW